MKYWRRGGVLLVGLFFLAILGLSPDVYWPVAGWLKGEAFYQGMPTSWWERQVSTYQRRGVVVSASSPWDPEWMYRGGWEMAPHYSLTEYLTWWRWGVIRQSWDDVPLVERDPASFGVLRELLKSSDPEARRLAVYGLQKLGTSYASGPRRIDVRPALAELRIAAEDSDEEVRDRAAIILRKLGE